MLSLNNIKPNKGSRKTSKKLGRGNGSGKGTYCGRGMNGQNCRSGGGVPDWFEGGQTPLFRRMPKLKGFSNAKFKKHYNLVNLKDLELLAKSGTTEITKEILLKNNIIRRKNLPVKLLGNGKITQKITISVAKVSITAKEAIEKIGGEIKILTTTVS